jgi:hypothetical protein
MVPSPLADVGEKKWAIFFDTALDAFAAASAKGSRTSEDDDDGLVRVGKRLSAYLRLLRQNAAAAM